MKYLILNLVCFVSTNLYCQRFDTENLSIDSNVYVFALKKYIEKNEVKNHLTIDFSESIKPKNLPKEILGVSISLIDYSKLDKKGIGLRKIFPLRFENGKFFITLVDFAVSKPKKNLTHFTNMLTSFSVYFEYDTESKLLKYISCRNTGCLGFTEFTD